MAHPWSRVINLADELNRDLASFTEQELTAEHARIARRERDKVVAESDIKPRYDTIVDGRNGASEDNVKPFGVIAYRFQYWGDIALFALELAQSLSPRASGKYRDSWFVLADGVLVDVNQIPPNARRIAITNDQPYHRKIEVGGMTVRAPGQNGIADAVRVAVNNRFSNSVIALVDFLSLSGPASGRQEEVPWRLRRGGKTRVNATGRTAAKSGVVNYPAIVIRPVGAA